MKVIHPFHFGFSTYQFGRYSVPTVSVFLDRRAHLKAVRGGFRRCDCHRALLRVSVLHYN